jgi:hypothetical protein
MEAVIPRRIANASLRDLQLLHEVVFGTPGSSGEEFAGIQRHIK